MEVEAFPREVQAFEARMDPSNVLTFAVRTRCHACKQPFETTAMLAASRGKDNVGGPVKDCEVVDIFCASCREAKAVRVRQAVRKRRRGWRR